MEAAEMTQAGPRRHRGMRVLRVLRTARITPRMQRLVLGGPEIEGIGEGPNLKLLLPPSRTRPPCWPTEGADGRPIWPADPDRPIVRTYSVRALDRARGELHVDFVLHGAGGVASAFAQTAEPGDLLGIGGPGGRGLPAAGFHLFAGDHSALPSIAAHLGRLPDEARGAAFIELPGPEEEQDLPRPPGVALTFLHRNGAAAGTTRLLQEAVFALDWPTDRSVAAWIAAESDAAREIRAHLKGPRGMKPRDLVAVGYWRRGMSETAYGAAYDHDRDADYHRAAREEDSHGHHEGNDDHQH
ncbi:siderophore-interacting protein [Aquabacter sp. L1I39]|uniref:siderophore-interacting protein n=1 Tax=Aquabacter sp. L1I39 TaxID=2820278 RepID=UPI001ADC393C|nr:siderophore-interacting protein [Aquabacter sp. L1I39]QTL05691.1 siderophore-interacting protein [Aquabacter sp. L1I39]